MRARAAGFYVVHHGEKRDHRPCLSGALAQRSRLALSGRFWCCLRVATESDVPSKVYLRSICDAFEVVRKDSECAYLDAAVESNVPSKAYLFSNRDDLRCYLRASSAFTSILPWGKIQSELCFPH